MNLSVEQALEWADKSDPFYGEICRAILAHRNRSTVVQVLAAEVRRLLEENAQLRAAENAGDFYNHLRWAKEAAEKELGDTRIALGHITEERDELRAKLKAAEEVVKAAKPQHWCDNAAYCSVCEAIAQYEQEVG